MKRKFLIVLLSLACIFCLAVALTACGDKVGGSLDGTYYVYRNDKYEKDNYIKINGSSWEDDDGVGGTLERNGDSLSFKGEIFGVTDEIYSGTVVSDGVLKIKIFGADIYYCKEGKTPSSSSGDNGSTNPATKFTVTYNANGGTFADGETFTQEVSENSLLTAPTQPTRTGYAFGGWAKNKGGSQLWQFATDKITENITLYAVWQESAASILSVEGASIDGDEILMIVSSTTESVSLSTKVICSSDSSWKLYYDRMGQTEIPTRIAAGLSGSLSNGDNVFYIVVTSANGSQVNTYKLTIYRQYNVSIQYFDNKDNWLYTETALTGEVFNTSYMPTITGYTFNHWEYRDGSEYKSVIIYESLNLFADATAKTYTVTLDVNGGNEISTTERTVTYDSSYSLPTATRTGYTFLGWGYKNSSDPITNNNGASLENWTGTSNTTLYAKWQINKYKVTLNKDLEAGGSVSGAGDYNYNTSRTITASTNNGYTWLGWYKGNELITMEFSYKFTLGAANETFTAKWIKVTVEGNGGGEVDTLNDKYILGQEITISANNEILGYTWLGWFNDSLLLTTNYSYTFNMPNKNTTFTAKWEIDKNLENLIFTSTETTCSVTGVKDKTVTEIIVPDYVTTISQGAFSGCSNLVNITIPFVGNSFKTSSDKYQYPFGYIFGTSSYSGAVATEQYYYGSSISSTTNTTYYIPSTLKSVTITGGNILYGAFYRCTSLTSIIIPESVTAIRGAAFYNCTGLTSITIPNSVTSIGIGAFRYCESLASITIPDSVTSIGERAFYGCTSLVSITIPDSVTSIGNYAFYDCRSLTSITIPDGVTSIGTSAFYDCRSLTSITIPDGVTSIGNNAFYRCTSLVSITIPDSVTSIGNYAFYDCTSLTSINYNGTIEQWNIIKKYDYWNSITANYTVYCTDGEITKDGTVTKY